ncbi:MAG: hypothetical protein ACKO2G_11150 [Verrucomicrobiales bacterium]
MLPGFRHIAVVLILVAFPACRQTGTSPAVIDVSPASTVTRADSLAIAEAYRTHRWRPNVRNVRHGVDAMGIQVDTPDRDFKPGGGIRPGWWIADQWNVGIPYQWGGFDSPEQFDAKVAAGYAAGDVYTPAKRAALYDAISQEACGVDCSGFISRCWRLPRAYSTRELPFLCEPLPDFYSLKPGDILNKTNEHVLLFIAWADENKSRLYAYETGSPPTWKVECHLIPTDFLIQIGYQPFRYRAMRD